MTDIAIAGTNRFFPDSNWTSHMFVDDEVMDDQFKHHLGMMFYGMSDLGECLEVARDLRPADEHAWLAAWSGMAERVEERAQAADRRGKSVSAASAYLRAATYWRAGLMHYGYGDDPRQIQYARNSYRCYDRYLELSGYPGTAVEIPYEGSFIPAYLYRSANAAPSAPILIFTQGRDAWPDDSRWVYDNAIKRGIDCLAVHGPGQGLALRLNDLHFRPDWEKVITPVVDFAIDLPGVDASRVGVMGLSFGGYLAPRAAAFEHRIKVCIADPGVLSWGGSIMAQFPPELKQAYDAGADVFNGAVGQATSADERSSWFLRDSMWKHGVDNPYDLFVELLACDLGPYVEQIESETLIMEGTYEIRSEGESQRLYDALRAPKHMMLFDESTTADLHCQGGASGIAGESMFDWLDERL